MWLRKATILSAYTVLLFLLPSTTNYGVKVRGLSRGSTGCSADRLTENHALSLTRQHVKHHLQPVPRN